MKQFFLLDLPVIRFQMLKSSVIISELDIHFPVTNSGINLPKTLKHLKDLKFRYIECIQYLF